MGFSRLSLPGSRLLLQPLRSATQQKLVRTASTRVAFHRRRNLRDHLRPRNTWLLSSTRACRSTVSRRATQRVCFGVVRHVSTVKGASPALIPRAHPIMRLQIMSAKTQRRQLWGPGESCENVKSGTESLPIGAVWTLGYLAPEALMVTGKRWYSITPPTLWECANPTFITVPIVGRGRGPQRSA